MLNFIVDQKLCTNCGLCVSDCPAMVITRDGGFPNIPAEKEESCFKCQHCLAICPVGAISILGIAPKDSSVLAGQFPSADQVETLIKGRR